jgi:two-component system response regulator MprA
MNRVLWDAENDIDTFEGQRRVLLVEDDSPLREQLAGEIRELGFDVEELGDGIELLDYFRAAASSYQSTLPDVVVAEVELPGCSGVEACDRLRKAGANVPFILICSHGLADLHAAAAAAGAEVVIDKPFDIQTLAGAVAAVAKN